MTEHRVKITNVSYKQCFLDKYKENTCNLDETYCFCGNEAVECSGRFDWYTPCEEHKNMPVEQFKHMRFLADKGLLND